MWFDQFKQNRIHSKISENFYVKKIELFATSTSTSATLHYTTWNKRKAEMDIHRCTHTYTLSRHIRLPRSLSTFDIYIFPTSISGKTPLPFQEFVFAATKGGWSDPRFSSAANRPSEYKSGRKRPTWREPFPKIIQMKTEASTADFPNEYVKVEPRRIENQTAVSLSRRFPFCGNFPLFVGFDWRFVFRVVKN